MYKYLFFILGIFASAKTFNPEQYTFSGQSYREGETLKYRIHFGFVNAGYARLELQKSFYHGKEVYHAKGRGWTVGATRFFFKVEDRYESIFEMGTVKPLHFIRRVDEGGYLISRDLYFDHEKGIVRIQDWIKNTDTTVNIGEVQDMVSAFYDLRNIDLSTVQPGDERRVDLFFDGETYPFKLRFLNKEVIETEFGDIRCWKIMPLVQKGRVFEGQESLTVWVSDDVNKVPLRIKASLVVGSLKADLEEYSGIVRDFELIHD